MIALLLAAALAWPSPPPTPTPRPGATPNHPRYVWCFEGPHTYCILDEEFVMPVGWHVTARHVYGDIIEFDLREDK